MECKSNNYTSVTNSDIELIDTLWNVNSNYSHPSYNQYSN